MIKTLIIVATLSGLGAWVYWVGLPLVAVIQEVQEVPNESVSQVHAAGQFAQYLSTPHAQPLVQKEVTQPLDELEVVTKKLDRLEQTVRDQSIDSVLYDEVLGEIVQVSRASKNDTEGHSQAKVFEFYERLGRLKVTPGLVEQVHQEALEYKQSIDHTRMDESLFADAQEGSPERVDPNQRNIAFFLVYRAMANQWDPSEERRRQLQEDFTMGEQEHQDDFTDLPARPY